MRPKTVYSIVAAVALAAFTPAVAAQAATARPSTGTSVSSSPPPARSTTPRRYLVLLKGSTASAARARSLSGRVGGKLLRTLGSLHGYVAEMTPAQASATWHDAQVAAISPDEIAHTMATETSAPWGLDRIDQASLPLDGTYSYANDGSGVNVYIVDTGIRTTNVDFGGRADYAWDGVGGTGAGGDCNGHGTHVAGIAGGARFGVAKNVALHAVRVLGCDGSGYDTTIAAGLDWIAGHATRPAVASMSLGGPPSTALDAAVNRLVASGVPIVVAAGNESTNACTESPSRVASAITVGATTSGDQRASYSNYGSCVDVYAPGSSVPSDWNSSDTATATLSGTSMATPHVTGAVALYLQSHPSASPAEVSQAIVQAAGSNLLGNGATPNLMLNVTGLQGAVTPPVSPTPSDTPTPVTPTPTPVTPTPSDTPTPVTPAPPSDTPAPVTPTPTPVTPAPSDSPAPVTPTPVPVPPPATPHFSWHCVSLRCVFTDATPSAHVLYRYWTFGDGSSGITHVPTAVRTYQRSGTYRVTMTAYVPDGSATKRISASALVTVIAVARPAPPIVLSLHKTTVPGYVLLQWTGSAYQVVVVYDNGNPIALGSGNNVYVNLAKGVSHHLRVCDAGTSVCSNTQVITLL